MKSIIFIVLLGVFVWNASPAASPAEDTVGGNTIFASEMYSQLKDTRGNIFFSPYSISAALAMTFAGAEENTAKQMAEILHFGEDRKSLHAAFAEIGKRLNAGQDAYELSTANALWAQKDYTFLKKFTDLLEENYGAGLNECDFINAAEKAGQTINRWVEEQTKNKIKELIKPGMTSPQTRLVLTNAIYFKGMWAAKFTKDMTRVAPFTLSDGTKTQVPMMYQKGKFVYSETEDFQVLDLPYRGEEISMRIFLPKKTDGLKNMEKKLSAEMLNIQLPEFKREIMVYLPKYKISSQFMLADVLHAMGMTDAFGPSADFSGMTGNKELFISAVIHKAFADVNEEGTEAAAATAVVMTRKTGAVRQAVFRADHPFIFMIRDNISGTVLFLGRVENPNK
ncbi:MAG: serpin family protein [Desulfococcaceae bacterium]|jgi:serpin B|nr:serpin family protein [Desulfococcaceae bacterium]